MLPVETVKQRWWRAWELRRSMDRWPFHGLKLCWWRPASSKGALALSISWLSFENDTGRSWTTKASGGYGTRPNKPGLVTGATGQRVRCLGSDPRRAHGAAPSLILLDEPAQWPDTSSDRMLAALRTAAGKQPTCRLIALGTLPADKEHWFSKMLFGGADYSQLHAAGKDAPKFQARTWHKANPSLRYMPDLLDAIRRESAKAKRDPAVLASFEALRLNLGTSDIMRSVLLGLDTWLAIEGEAPAEGGCVWGIDLGTSAAQSAIAAFWPDTGRAGMHGGVSH